nr:MFS transporter [Actinomyces sp.]
MAEEAEVVAVARRWSRELICVVGSITGNSLLFSFAGVALPLVMLQVYGLRSAILNGLSVNIALIVAMPFGGALCDRYEPGRLLLWGYGVAALGYGSVGLMVASGSPRATVVVPVIMMAVGLVQALTAPCIRILVQKCRQEHGGQSGRIYPVIRSAQNIARVLGPCLAGVAVLGPSWLVFGVTVGACVLFAVLALRLPPALGAHGSSDAQAPAPVHTLVASWFLQLAEGARAFVGYRWLVVLTVSSSLMLAAWQSGFSYLAPDIFLAHGGSSAQWGLLVSVFNAGSLVGSLVAIRLPARRALLWSLVFFVPLSPVLLAVGAHATVWVLAPAMVLAGLAWDWAVYYGEISVLDGVDRRVMGRVTSFSAMGERVGMLLGGFAALVPEGDAQKTAALAVAALVTVAAGAGGLAVTRAVGRRGGATQVWDSVSWRLAMAPMRDGTR